jgi:hypothetical protein
VSLEMGNRIFRNLKKKKNNDQDLAANETLIDFCAKRRIRKSEDSFIDFVSNYEIKKGK